MFHIVDIIDVKLDSPIMQEEIFGPLLPIIKVNNVEEVRYEIIKRFLLLEGRLLRLCEQWTSLLHCIYSARTEKLSTCNSALIFIVSF